MIILEDEILVADLFDSDAVVEAIITWPLGDS